MWPCYFSDLARLKFLVRLLCFFVFFFVSFVFGMRREAWPRM